MSDRVIVWKHDCVKHGEGRGKPCEPACGDPWNVDVAEQGGMVTFGTFERAIDFAQRLAHQVAA